MDASTFDEERFRAALTTRALGRVLRYQPVVDSTMRLAREAADAGAVHGTLFLAEEQTAGRGRQGRSFYSPPGENLYFTILLRDTPSALRSVALAVPLAVCSAVRELGADALIKWPNDIWAGGLKLSGILIDAQGTGDELVAMPGVGINVNTEFGGIEGLRDTATSIRSAIGRRVQREPLLASICNGLESLLGQTDVFVAAEYRKQSLILGEQIVVSPRSGEPFEGLAEEIRADGALQVRLPDGTVHVVQAAEVSLRPRRSGVDLSS